MPAGMPALPRGGVVAARGWHESPSKFRASQRRRRKRKILVGCGNGAGVGGQGDGQKKESEAGETASGHESRIASLRERKKGEATGMGGSGHGPAKKREDEEESEGRETDEGKSFAVAEEAVASFGLDAEDGRDEEYGAPGNGAGHAGIAGEEGEGLFRRLTGRKPPWKDGSETGGKDEGEKFAADPTFDFGHGLVANDLAPDEKLPSEECGRERDPAVKGAVEVKPEPGAEKEAGRMGGDQPRKEQPPGQGVRKNSEKQNDQADELHPLF